MGHGIWKITLDLMQYVLAQLMAKCIEAVIKKEAEYRNIPDKIKSYLNQTSLKTFIESEEVIGMIIYLLSPLAKKITGQMLVIDGHTKPYQCWRQINTVKAWYEKLVKKSSSNWRARKPIT